MHVIVHSALSSIGRVRGGVSTVVGRGSPFDQLRQIECGSCWWGVGHNRNSFLHHAESLIERPRLKQRRFPVMVNGERVWWETLDVGDDNDTHFPVVGREYEQQARIRSVQVGHARTVLLSASDFVSFAGQRVAELFDDAWVDHPSSR